MIFKKSLGNNSYYLEVDELLNICTNWLVFDLEPRIVMVSIASAVVKKDKILCHNWQQNYKHDGCGKAQSNNDANLVVSAKVPSVTYSSCKLVSWWFSVFSVHAWTGICLDDRLCLDRQKLRHGICLLAEFTFQRIFWKLTNCPLIRL